MPPRLRVHLWKLAHGALPLAKIMSSRLGQGVPTCILCGQADEDALHMSLKCPFARSCWFASELALKTEAFDSLIKEVLLQLVNFTTEDMWQTLVISMWCIWRCRNDCIFQGKVPSLQSFNSFMSLIKSELLVSSTKGQAMVNPQASSSLQLTPIRSEFECFVDGS